MDAVAADVKGFVHDDEDDENNDDVFVAVVVAVVVGDVAVSAVGLVVVGLIA